MSRYKRATNKWKKVTTFSRKSSDGKKNRFIGRNRRRENAKYVFRSSVKRCNPLSSIKKPKYTSHSTQVSLPTLLREEIFSQNDATSVVHRSSAPGKLLQYSLPVIDLLNDNDDGNSSSCPPTPTPSSHRPNSNLRTSGNSHYIIYRDPLEEKEIDTRIYDMLMKGPKESDCSSTQAHGRVYCALRRETPGYIKIGSTGKAPSDRMKQISPKRRFGTFTWTETGVFTHYKLAEDLIHVELWNQRRKSKFQDMLGGHTFELLERETIAGSPKQVAESGRTEWFQIEQDHADEVRDKWVTWLRKCNPYSQSGELDAFWKSWFTRHIKTNYSKTTHISLHLRWNALLNPTRLQIYRHYLAPAADQCFAWVKCNPWVPFVMIVSCVCLTLSCLYPRLMVFGLIIGVVMTMHLRTSHNDTKVKRR